MYPESFKDELKNKVNISEVVSKALALKSRGKDYVGLCPFHKEKTPSFTVNDMRRSYHCFGCGAHGDIFTFVMKTEGLDFKRAIEKIAVDYGISLPKLIESKKTDEEKREIELLYEINEEACRFFEENIFKPGGKGGVNYARKRGLKDKDIKKFRIGFALNNFNSLLNHLKDSGYSEKDAVNAGVIVEKEGKIYDKFRNRLMFPVLDMKGRVIAFTGRIIDDGMPKYMNSPETKIYHKSNILFNYFFARKPIYQAGYGVLVEGNLDTISLFIGGVENVVAPMGTAVTESQLRNLWRTTDRIVVCLDGDTAGRKASKRISELVLPILTVNKSVDFAFLPKDKDPDDFIREYGKYQLMKVFENSLSLSDFIWYSQLEKLGLNGKSFESASPELKAKLESNLSNVSNKIQNDVLRRHFGNHYKKKIWFTKKRTRKSQLKSKTGINYLTKVPAVNTIDKIREKITKCEKKILLYIIEYPNVSEQLFEKFGINVCALNFCDAETLAILNLFEEFYDKNSFNKEKFIVELENNNFNNYLKYRKTFLDSGYSGSVGDAKVLAILNRLVLEREIAILEVELKNIAYENADLEKIKILQNQLNELRQRKVLLDNEFDFI